MKGKDNEFWICLHLDVTELAEWMNLFGYVWAWDSRELAEQMNVFALYVGNEFRSIACFDVLCRDFI